MKGGLQKAMTQLEKRVEELEKMVKNEDERVLGLREEKMERPYDNYLCMKINLAFCLKKNC